MTRLSARELAIPGRLGSTDLEINGGELVALVGPNGGGKTSLLRALARIEGADGIVAIDGEDIDDAPIARRRQLEGDQRATAKALYQSQERNGGCGSQRRVRGRPRRMAFDKEDA